jgi:uncharacterized protein
VPDAAVLAIALPVLAIAYTVFGMVGFGSALIAAPLLAHVMPVATLIPLLALLDLAGASLNGFKLGSHVARPEVRRLAPGSVLGSLVGVAALVVVAPRAMMLALGAFVVLYALYSLVAAPPAGRVGAGWSAVAGPVGGVLSAMFGSGGFVYAMYLARRVDSKDVLFALAGLYADVRLLVTAALLVPAMALGLWLAGRITLRLSRETFLRVLYCVLLATGSSLAIRAWLMPH